MTVNTTNITSGPYVGNDVADTFSYTFRITDKSQISVYETDDNGVQTLLTVDTDYTVVGIGDDAGGTITRVAGALPTDYEWFIRSNYKETQLTAFESQGAYFPDLHENMADKLTFLIQQLRDSVSRCPKLDDGFGGLIPLTLDDPVGLEFLRWKSDLSGVESVDLTTGGSPTTSDLVTYNQGGANAINRTVEARLQERASILDFGAVGDDSTDNLIAFTNAFAWLAMGANRTLHGSDGIFQCSGTITQALTAAANFISTPGFIVKFTGAVRTDGFKFTGVTNDFFVQDVTLDANDIVARPITINNASADQNNVADVTLVRLKTRNSKQDTGTGVATGIYVRGGFRKLTMVNPVIDKVDSTLVAGAGTLGIFVGQETGVNNRCQHIEITGHVIKDVKNPTTIDSDGIGVFADTTEDDAEVKITNGTFINCKGRSFKSQYQRNIVTGNSVIRTAYTGNAEFDLQYSGAFVSGNNFFYDGFIPASIIFANRRLTPDNYPFIVTGNIVKAINVTGSNFISHDAADATVAVENIVVENNIFNGTCDNFVTLRLADVTGNQISINNNQFDTCSNAFIKTSAFGGGTPLILATVRDNKGKNAPGLAVEQTQSTQFRPLKWDGNSNIPDFKLHFRAYMTSNQVDITGDGTNADVIFDTVDYDPHGSYNNSTGAFTPKLSGKYRLIYSLAYEDLDVGNTDLTAQLSDPGVLSLFFADINPSAIFTSGGELIVSGEQTIDMTQGNPHYIRTQVSGGTKIVDIKGNANQRSSFFMAELIQE